MCFSWCGWLISLFLLVGLQNACTKLVRHVLMWVEEQTYWIALRFLSLGFELDLYSPEEYCMVYWYLYVILVKLAEKTHLKNVASTDSGLSLLCLVCYSVCNAYFATFIVATHIGIPH